MECLPTASPPPSSRRTRKAISSWDSCLLSLRRLQNALASLTQPHGTRRIPPGIEFSLVEIRRQWSIGTNRLIHLTRHRSTQVSDAPSSSSDWDSFHSAPIRWALAQGFGQDVAMRLPTATQPPPPRDQLLVDLKLELAWVSPPTGPRSARSALDQLKVWKELATRARDACRRLGGKSFHASRLECLQSHDLGTWMRLMKNSSQTGLGYSPEWYTTSDGTVTRPSCPSEALLGAAQAWEPLFSPPATTWHHPLVVQWKDNLGCSRGSLNFSALASALVDPGAAQLARACLANGPWSVVPWTGLMISVVSEHSVHISHWHLHRSEDGWHAATQPPCNGYAKVVEVCGEPPITWTADRWHDAAVNLAQGHFVVQHYSRGAHLLAPLTASERTALKRKMRRSRPGPSQFKLAFLDLFPAWAEEAYWESLDIQRACSMIAECLKYALQINMPKPAGGHRPLTMLEEDFKAIEGAATRRQVAPRKSRYSDPVYSLLNKGYSPGVAAAPEALYLDALVCEDAALHSRPLARLGIDFAKYFNSIVLAEVDAMWHAKGLQDDVRNVYLEAFDGLHIAIDTR